MKFLLLGKRKDLHFDPNMYYAWCMGCNKLKEHMARECARDVPTDLKGFKCEECMDQEVAEEAAARGVPIEGREFTGKHCPKCDVATKRTYGCAKMSCPCGVYWCYECAEYSSNVEDDVYRHMTTEHGGYGYGDYDNDDDNDNEYNDNNDSDYESDY